MGSIIFLNEPKDYQCGHKCKYFKGAKFVKGVRFPEIAEKLVLSHLRNTCHKQPNAPAQVINECTKTCSLNLAILELDPKKANDLLTGKTKADEESPN